MSDSPPISITVTTILGWPDVCAAIASMEAAAAAVNGEVIVTDGSGRPQPDRSALGPATVWRQKHGASVFQLRGLAYELSRAPIIATTEDHCIVPLEWASRMLDAHAAHPDAAAVSGSVENGATDSILDWASFLRPGTDRVTDLEWSRIEVGRQCQRVLQTPGYFVGR